MKDLLTEILFYFQEFQNERQHHQAFSRYVCSDGFTLKNCRGNDGHEGCCFLLGYCMGANLDASAKQAEATNVAIHGLDESVKTVTDSIEAQTKTVTALGTEQSKVTKEISKALETQNSQQKDANTTLAEQKKIMQEQEAEIKKVTKAVDSQTGVLQKNASGWKMLMTGFAIKFASEVVDGFKSIISTGLEASRVYEDMSARLTPLVGDLETAILK